MTAQRPIKYVYLETTNHCNLDCVFCNRRDVVNANNLRHMTIENWQYCLEKLSGHPIEQAKLMGLGEPFFHPQFDTITRLFKEEFPDCFTISATNLQYKIKERFFKAAESLDLLYFSIDGYKESYEKARPGSKWSTLLKSLDDIEEHYLKTSFDKKPPLKLILYTADTIDSLDEVATLAKNIVLSMTYGSMLHSGGERKLRSYSRIQKELLASCVTTQTKSKVKHLGILKIVGGHEKEFT